jgi:hypothetical protein
MPDLPAVSSAPVAFGSLDGKYFQIPISAIYFDANGAAKADRWPLYNKVDSNNFPYKKIIDPLLAELVFQGALIAGPEPPHKPAFTATAKTPGATGILVKIDISNVVADPGNNPPASTADFTVTETDTYTAVTADKLVEAIGNAPNGGQRPGLVFVSSGGAPGLPKPNVADTPYKMTAANANDPATVDIPPDSGAGTAFTLKSRGGGPDASLATIDIQNVDEGAKTFTLVATWTKTQKALAMSGLAAAFNYILDIHSPQGGFLVPAEGSFVLSGGSDAIAVNPVKASAIVFTK